MTGTIPPESPRVRVALLGSFPPQTQGIPIYCGGLAESLSQLCNVTALGFKAMYPRAFFPGVKDATDATRPALAAPGLQLTHRLTWYNPFSWLRAAMVPADIAHAQWWSLPLSPIAAAFLAITRLRGKPAVVTVHNVRPHEPSRLFTIALRVVCGLASRIVVHSVSNRRVLLDTHGIPESKVTVIPHGARHRLAEGPARAEAREHLDVPPDVPVLLFFGIIRPYKGLDVLLDAFARLRETRPEALLVIAGKPWEPWHPYQARIEALGLSESVRTHLNYIPESDLAVFFRAADVAVLPYLHFDGQSGVGGHNLIYRTPMLVSNVGGLPEWVEERPEWIFPASDAEALSARLKDFFVEREVRTRDFAALADRVLERTAWPRVAELHARLYRELMAERRSG